MEEYIQAVSYTHLDRNAFCLILLQMHINFIRNMLLFYDHSDMGFLLIKMNHLSIFASFV